MEALGDELPWEEEAAPSYLQAINAPAGEPAGALPATGGQQTVRFLLLTSNLFSLHKEKEEEEERSSKEEFLLVVVVEKLSLK